MGTKNCPETPRQRMIGMMYLVLTAMLALNVSADVLEAFTKVQHGLNTTVENTRRKNKELYNDIEMSYQLNPAKVNTVRNKALELKERSFEITQFLDQLKHRMVLLADGQEGKVDELQAKDNLDIGGQVMVLERQGTVLKQKLADLATLVTEYVAPKDSIFRQTILSRLDTSDPKLGENGMKSWEASKFEGIPLVGVLTLLSMYQSDILNIESDLLHYLYASIDAESFKFNKLEALVIPESRYILRGENFKAKILLAAVDSTQRPTVMINGQPVPYTGDYACYSQLANQPGIQRLAGVIHYQTPSGQLLPQSFETTYMVAEPAVVVSPTKMNVFYAGVDNPLAIAAPGISLEDIEPQITNGTIHKVSDGNYIVRPGVVGKACVVSVFGDFQGVKRKLQSYQFRVKEVPDPVAKVAGLRGGGIRKNLLLAAGGLNVEMENFDFDMKFTVENFSVYTVIDGYVQEEVGSHKSSFSPSQIKMIQKLRRNQALTIENIIVKGADGTIRKLPSISFKLE